MTREEALAAMREAFPDAASVHVELFDIDKWGVGVTFGEVGDPDRRRYGVRVVELDAAHIAEVIELFRDQPAERSAA